MKKSKPTSAAKPQAVEWNETEQAELLEARDEALRQRYRVEPEVATYLDRLITITQQHEAKKGHTAAKMVVLALEIGERILTEALTQKTDFLDGLSTAIRQDAAGLSVETKFQLAYSAAGLAAKKEYLSRWKRGEHNMDNTDEVLPTIGDVVEMYLRIKSSAKPESAEAQIKRWLKKSGNKTVSKRRKP